MTPGDPTEQLPVTKGTPSSAASKVPLRPADVDKALADAKSEARARHEADRAAAARAKSQADADKARAAIAGSSSGAGSSSASAASSAGRNPQGQAPQGESAKGGVATAKRPESRPSGSRPTSGAPRQAPAGRRVRLTLSRIDPWSALKMSFLLSVALGIALVVAVSALWLVFKGMGAFDAINDLVGKIVQEGDRPFDINDWVGFDRVLSLSIVFAVIDVFLVTAIATLGAFIYNVSASLVGGLGLTLTDD